MQDTHAENEAARNRFREELEHNEKKRNALLAAMYHCQGFNQPQIAEAMGVSQATVSRWLREAMQERWLVHAAPVLSEDVEQTYLPVLSEHFAVLPRHGEALKAAFAREVAEGKSRSRLRWLAVVPGGAEENPERSRRLVGAAGARRLAELVSRVVARSRSSRSKYIYLGILWGRTLAALAACSQSLRVPRLVVLPLIGGTPTTAVFPQAGDDANTLAKMLTRQFGGQHDPMPLTVPAAITTEFSPDEAAVIRKFVATDPSYREILGPGGLAEQVRIAILGIGSASEAYVAEWLSARPYVTLEELEQLRADGFHGDIACRFFGCYPGLRSETAEIVNQRALGIELERIATISADPERHVLACAASSDKAQAIAGAVRCGLVTDLVTDEFAAKAILRSLGVEPPEEPPYVRIGRGR